MTAPKGYAGTRTVTVPRAVWYYVLILAFAGLVTLIGASALGIYFGVVLANRPDVPLQAPDAPAAKGKP